MKEKEMKFIGEKIIEVLEIIKDYFKNKEKIFYSGIYQKKKNRIYKKFDNEMKNNKKIKMIKNEVKKMALKFPIP